MTVLSLRKEEIQKLEESLTHFHFAVLESKDIVTHYQTLSSDTALSLGHMILGTQKIARVISALACRYLSSD